MSLPIHVAYSFGAIFALVGICVVNFSIRDLIRAKASVDWSTTLVQAKS
jgi:hypothetical protein